MQELKYKDLPVERGDKLKLTVTMQVSAPQAYALIAMFKYWTVCGKIGCSREIGFYADGDGDFQPNCEITTEPKLPEMPDLQAQKAIVRDENGNRLYDFDPIAWSLHDECPP